MVALVVDRQAVFDVIPTARESKLAMSGVPQRMRDEAMIAFDKWLHDEMSFEREIEFAEGKRKWRLDYGREVLMLAVEREGGTWAAGRHSRGSGQYGDITKYNSAALLGWTVLRFAVDHIVSGEAYRMVELAVAQRTEVQRLQASPKAPAKRARKAPPHVPTTLPDQSDPPLAKRPGQRRAVAAGHPGSARPRYRAPVTG